MAFGTDDPPMPPNPTATAAAQTGTNVSTAIANSYLGNVNQNTPQGTLAFDPNKLPGYNFTDPTSGNTYTIPRWTATQELNPQALETFNQTQAAQGNLAGMANQQSASLGKLLGSSFDPSQGNFDVSGYLKTNPDVLAYAQSTGQDPYAYAQQHWQQLGQNEGRTSGTSPPNMGDIGLYNQVSGPQSQIFDAQRYMQQYPDIREAAARSGQSPEDFARQHWQTMGQREGRSWMDPVQGTYGSGGDITRSYGPADNFSADRQRIEQSMFERVNPQLQQDEARLRQRLADQGINYGSQAFTGAYDPFNRSVTDTRLGIVQAGGAEQQRMNEMARNQAMFGNQAQAQAEGQLAARGAFANQAAQSQFAQALGQGQFFNQAQNQMLGRQSAMFNAQNQLRNQALQEGYQQRTQPINEITALLSGSQVQQPNFINAQRNTIPTTDVAGLINQNFAQQNDLYKTDTAFWGDIIGGGLGAAGKIGAGYFASDVRVKENIAPMGSIMSTKGELPIYEYSYKGDRDDGQRHVGPMAQDVEKLDPSAVKSFGGVKHINREKLGSIFGSA